MATARRIRVQAGGTWRVAACLWALAACAAHADDLLARLEAARTPELERSLTNLAREAIALRLREGRVLATPRALPDLWRRPAGVFVSLGRKGHDRGCRGTLHPTQANLAAEIIHSAIAAATEDDRFAPVTADELPDLEYLVSVVGDLQPIHGPRDLTPGVHGLALSGPRGTGVLLPGEARTASWEWRECCRRAGVSSSPRPRAVRFRTVLFRSHGVRR
jgi:uncharacterized protein (TIGR00296 family)